MFTADEVLSGPFMEQWFVENPEEPKDMEPGPFVEVFVQNNYDEAVIRGGWVRVPHGFDFAAACAATKNDHVNREAALLIQIVMLLVKKGSSVSLEASTHGFLLKPDTADFGIVWD